MALACLCWYSFSQPTTSTKDSLLLNEIVLTGQRITLPLSQTTHAIHIISKTQIERSGAQQLVQLLQTVAGVDVRQRGIGGTQADLYIRGGSFDQTLLLIDGMKLDDVQTGHHTLNAALPVQAIERIEIIKGPAARVYGANAFTGAINIITKTTPNERPSVGAHYGSFNQFGAQLNGGIAGDTTSLWGSTQWEQSEGYRYNTDYNTFNGFVKAKATLGKLPLYGLGFFNRRAFGANGFYASPEATDQYEETQAGFFGVHTQWKTAAWTLSPRIYWRRGQDIYLFVRNRPEIYRNKHISNKVVAAIDASVTTALGRSGIGIESATVGLHSNNLGQRNRQQLTLFLEHKFRLWQQRLSITPGVALNYFSDFKWHSFPGIDVGLFVSPQLGLFGNYGYTYRIPTYTDLFYSDPTTAGNSNLLPESALTHELGFKYNPKYLRLEGSYFKRNAKDLIDYIKPNATALWQAQNIQKVITEGVELSAAYTRSKVSLQLQYTYLTDALAGRNLPFSRYSLNSLQHQLNANASASVGNAWKVFLGYRYGERQTGSPFNVVDASATYTKGAWQIRLRGNNIFSARYTETQLIPMPLAHGRLQIIRFF